MASVASFFTYPGYHQPKTRLGVDNNFGHYICPTPPAISSLTVFTDQIAQTRVTDDYVPHCLHPTKAAIGSKTTYTDQLETFRILDTLSCGDKSAMGSLTTWAGG